MAATAFVVDSEISTSEKISAALSQAGFWPLLFGSSIEALDALQAGAVVDVLITTLNFPGNCPQGVALALAARRLRPAVKVVFMGNKDLQPYLEDVGILVPLPTTPTCVVDAVRRLFTNS